MKIEHATDILQNAAHRQPSPKQLQIKQTQTSQVDVGQSRKKDPHTAYRRKVKSGRNKGAVDNLHTEELLSVSLLSG